MDKKTIIAICKQETKNDKAMYIPEFTDAFILNLFDGDSIILSNAYRLALSYKDIICLFVGDEYEGIFMQTRQEITYPTKEWDFIQEAIEASGYALTDADAE